MVKPSKGKKRFVKEEPADEGNYMLRRN